MTPTLATRPVRLILTSGAPRSAGAGATCARAQYDPGPPPARPAAPSLTPRQQEILRGIPEYAPWDCPDRWLHELGPAARRAPILRARMLASTSWVKFLAYAVLLDWSDGQAQGHCDALLRALPGVKSGKVRQNVIFLVALTAPDARGTLRPVFKAAGRPADRADAGVALAMLGDEAGFAFFADGFAPSDCMRGQPVFSFKDYVKLEGREDGRDMTRSYRAWEVLFRRPYFRRLQYLTRSGLYGLRRGQLSEGRRRERVRKLLPLFPIKWPGHPGSDDFAAILCDQAIGAGDRLAAYRWAQRSTLLPDQDRGLRDVFAAMAESQLSRAELDVLLDSPDGKNNRQFLLYTKYLALAKTDLAKGLEFFDGQAAADPLSLFAHARKLAARVSVPGGLRAGAVEPLGLQLVVSYPERSKALAKTVTRQRATEDSYEVLTRWEREVVRRTLLVRQDSIELSVKRVAKQYRTHVELRELQVREAKERSPLRKADLRFRQATIVYRSPDVFFPVWGRHTMNFGYALNRVRCDGEADLRLRDYVAKTFSLRRAYVLYEGLLKEFPDYPARDQVLFNLGQCYAKLMDYRPGKGVDVWVFPEDQTIATEVTAAFAHRRVAEWFERLVRTCPSSPLVERAEAAAAYRRKMVRRAQRRAKR